MSTEGTTPADEVALPRGAKGVVPRYFEDGDTGTVLSMVIGLTGEFSVLRDRLDTIERLMDAGLPVTRAAIESYYPDEAVRQQRDAWRQELLSVVFRVLHERRDALARRSPPGAGDGAQAAGAVAGD